MDFPAGTTDDLLALIAEHPLAWVVSHDGERFDATPLPLLAETDGSGELVALIGHCSRRNRQVEMLRRDPRALILFSGPHGYISPALVRQPRWVPTWNFAVAIVHADITFLDEQTTAFVEQLVDHAEADQPSPWTMADAGGRDAQLMPYIIGFRAAVRDVQARFKMGQDETAETLADIIAGHGDVALRRWMERANHDRLVTVALQEHG